MSVNGLERNGAALSASFKIDAPKPSSNRDPGLAQLLKRVAEGDRAAFAALYQATSLKLFGVVLRILRREELAEEILQEVYVKIWQRASDFTSDKASPIAWMAAIARNRAIDSLRRRQPSLVENNPGIEDVADGSATPGEQLEMSEELRRLEACLDGLEETKSKMVRLAYLDGYSRQDLAERFDQPVGTIKTWLHRSLKQLRDCLGS